MWNLNLAYIRAVIIQIAIIKQSINFTEVEFYNLINIFEGNKYPPKGLSTKNAPSEYGFGLP